jgi:hypothetical protein
MLIEIVEASLTLPEHARAVILLLGDYARDPMGGGEALPPFVRENLVSELRKRDAVHVILALSIAIQRGSLFAWKDSARLHVGRY